MKYFFFIVVLSLHSIILVQSQTKNINSISVANRAYVLFTSSNLPIVVINTGGQIIPDDYKITADMGIIYNGEGVRNNLTDPYNNYNGKIGIEVRGSSSQMFPKKQYAVETRDILGNDLNVSLLGFPEESDWILYAPYNDKSLVRDVIAYKITNDMGWYASRSKFCEVVLDGDYVGVYVLLEKVKRDANRVDIKKLEPADITGVALTGGYIIKIDKTDGENNDGWYSTFLPFPQSPYSVFYQYHYPTPDEIVQQQKDYIQHKIFQFETMMAYAVNIADTATGFPKFLDTDSFVDFIIINEFAKNVDAYRLSTYLYKNRDDINTKIFAGPVWDFNISFGNAYYYEGYMTEGWQLQYLTDYQNIPIEEPFLTPNWWRKLFDNTDFRNKVYSRWQEVKINALSKTHVLNYIDSLARLLNESKTRNFERWPILGENIWPNYYVGLTYEQEIDYLKSWIASRLNWMDTNMIGEPTDNDDVRAEIPKNFLLEQNYPNPFNPSTNIQYAISSGQFISLKVYDMLGNEVATLVEGYKSAGSYEVEFPPTVGPTSGIKNPVSGIYFYRLIVGNYVETKKMILLK